MSIPALCSYIRRKDMDSVLNCMVSDNLAPGEYGERLLKAIREKLGYDYTLALRSPMAALGIALDALGLAAGDTVGLSALSDRWVARLLEHKGLKPLWLDVDQSNAAIALGTAGEKLAGAGAKALYLAEPWGIMPDPTGIAELGVPIIEDISTSLGASFGEIKAGSLGVFALQSLEHAAAFTGGGGALLSASLRRDAQVLRNLAERLVPEELLPDMNAALALSQLKDFEKFKERRKDIFSLYEQSLVRGHKKYLAQAGDGVGAYYSCVVVLDTGIKDVRAYAKKKDVSTLMAFETSCLAAGFVPEGLCPQAASLANRALVFPLHPRVGAMAAQKVAKVLATLP